MAVTAALSACQSDPATPTAAKPTPTATDVYVTGAKSTDDPCKRVISAIGYLELLLVPSGEETTQTYDQGVRGRFGYLNGVISMYGPHLPVKLKDAVAVVGQNSRTLANSQTPQGRRVALLKGYRKAAGSITDACQTASPSAT